jgi:predicted negative regulator of RcsB-dependent stress response
MAYDLEEQEQIAALKSWWRENGLLVMLVVVAASLSFAGFNGWRYYRNSQAAAAVALYEQLDQAERAADHKKVREIAGTLTDKYGSTAYGAYGALSAAAASIRMGDLAGARTHLQWAIDNAGEDEVKDVARLRLAGVLLDEKKHEEALKVLEHKPVESLAGLYADRRGDILLSQGKRAEARAAYQAALDKSEAASAYRSIIQMKLDSLGEAK